MKRPRTEASSTQNTEGMKVDEDMWDLGHHRREATRLQNLRNIEIGLLKKHQRPEQARSGISIIRGWDSLAVSHTG